MESKALLVLNYRQLALIYELTGDVASDESYPISQRKEAKEVHQECADMIGRDTDFSRKSC